MVSWTTEFEKGRRGVGLWVACWRRGVDSYRVDEVWLAYNSQPKVWPALTSRANGRGGQRSQIAPLADTAGAHYLRH
jgi:hypothetical protein